MGDETKIPSAFNSETFGKDAAFHLDEHVGSASISPCGRDVVLASSEGLHIVDLDSPYAPPRHLVHRTPWAVADVQWSPFASRADWIVSTSNQKALVWNLSMPTRQSSVEFMLHGHSRAITDINFSAHHPDILATCAVDSYVLCWDLRIPIKPALKFCDWFAGATQVKWNRQDSHLLASSHDKYLKLWDDRKGAIPVRTIVAHQTKIYGVDWDRYNSNKLATCSLDKTIKIWNVQADTSEPEKVIHTDFPVWRARHTPFGHGIVALPQRSDNGLHLYNEQRSFKKTDEGETATKADHRFHGHKDSVKEFLWRSRGPVTNDSDEREFQLVSWGMDRELRLHAVNDDILRQVGLIRGQSVDRKLNVTRKGSPYISYREEPTEPENSLRYTPATSRIREMQGMAISFSTGYGGEGFAKATGQASRQDQKTLDHLSWIRGVRIGDRAREGQAPSTDVDENGLTLAFKPSQSWVTFESLGEEITHVLEKFPRVKVDDIDVQRRRLILGLSGPWATDSTFVAFRCHLQFPRTYPRTHAPEIELSSSSTMDDEISTVLVRDMAEILEAYRSLGRNSLEALLRYLLGEQTLAECRKDLESCVEIGTVAPDLDVGYLSSSEDETEAVITSGRPRDLSASDPNLDYKVLTYNVPLPRTCNATWDYKGRLICIFSTRSDRDMTMFGHGLNMENRKHEYFEGFGRLTASLSSKKSGSGGGLLRVYDDENDGEWDSFSESSRSTSADLSQPHWHPFTTMPFVFAAEKPLEASLEFSNKSLGETDFPLSFGMRDTISIIFKDVRDILPMSEDLARHYRIGHSVKDIETNASLSAAQSCEKTYAWKWLAMEIRAASLENHCQASVENVDLLSLSSEAAFNSWPMKVLFEHFERVDDIQTLAMLTYAWMKRKSSDAPRRQTLNNSMRQACVSGHSRRISSKSITSDQVMRSSGETTAALQTFQTQVLSRVASSIDSALQAKSSNISARSPGSAHNSYSRMTPSKALAHFGFSVSPEAALQPDSSSNSITASFPRIFHRINSSSANTSQDQPTRAAGRLSFESTRSRMPSISSLSAGVSRANVTKAPGSIDEVGRSNSLPPDRVEIIKADHFVYMGNRQDCERKGTVGAYMMSKAPMWLSSYANHLLAFGLPLHSARIRKAIALLAPLGQEVKEPTQSTLETLRYCPRCGAAIGTGARSCRHCAQKSLLTTCAVCEGLILKLALPCVKCEHAFHSACWDAFWYQDADGLACPSPGCACVCCEQGPPDPTGLLRATTPQFKTASLKRPGQKSSIAREQDRDRGREASPAITVRRAR